MNGENPDPRRRPLPPQGPPPRRPAPPRRPVPPPDPRPEGTQVIRRSPQPRGPRAWSEAPPPQRTPSPPPPQRPPLRRPPPPRRAAPQQQRDWAPPQTPERFVDDRKRPAPARGAAPPRTPTPPRRPARPEPAPRRRRPGVMRRVLRRTVILLVVLLVAGVGGIVWFDGKLQRVDAIPAYEGRIGDTPGTNWLLVGSDSRVGLTPEQEQELATGGDVGPDRTDTILLVHVPSGSGPTTMVSLPRDSYVPVPGFGEDKLNASFALGGPQLLVQTVEGATGIHVDHYVEIGFGGFASIVDAIGGVDVCVPYAIDDPLAGLQVEAGCQELTGAQALGFVRTRATPLADLDRMNNQRLFLSALLSKATSMGTFLNPFRLWPLVAGAAGSLRVDEGDHLWDLARLAWAMRGETVTATVPVGGFQDVWGVGNVLLWDDYLAPQFFDALAQDQPIPAELLGP